MRWLAFLVLFFTIVPGDGRASELPDPDKLSTLDRVAMASQIYASIQMFFGHWKGVPGLNLDTEYDAYLQKILASDKRYDFDLATMEFIAKLQNGHSGFDDPWLRKTFGQQLGFFAYPVDGQWVVSRSSLSDLKPGDILTKIGDEKFTDFYQRVRKYISASNERWRQRALCEKTYLFPQEFQLTLADGRIVAIRRQGEFQWAGAEYSSIQASEQEGVAILRIPSFGKEVFEQSAVEYLQKLKAAKAVVLDLRGNHGGTTPDQLVGALMDRPYRYWSESTPATVGLLQVWNGEDARTDLTWTASLQNPAQTAYRGPLYILVDGGCYSACEDAVVPFKDNHRGVILGERTGGSTGQPFRHNLKYGMRISLSTKREYFADGSPFEGVGIAPDVEVLTTAADLRSGNDPVLTKALAMVRAAK